MKKRKDYCGPYWLPSFIRRIMSIKFNASCKIHDLDYFSKKYSRLEADKRFLNHTKRQAKNNIIFISIAYLYYFMVRIGGRISWKRGNK